MGPWEKYSAPAPQGVLGTIPGRADPYKVRDQQLQEEAAVRAREDQEFQRIKFAAEQEDRIRKASEPTEAKAAEQASAGYYGRALNAHNLYGEGAPPLSLERTLLINAMPRAARSKLLSPQERAAFNYIDEFIRAKLRKESGAAIPPDEMAQEYPVYFAQPGEGPDDMARKKVIREQAIEGLRVAAGSAAGSVKLVGGKRLDNQEILPSIGAPPAPSKLQLPSPLPDAPEGAPSPDEVQFGADPRSDQEKLEQTFAGQLGARINRGDSIEELNAWLATQKRVPLNQEQISDIRMGRSKGIQIGVTPVPVLTPEEQAEADRRAAEGGGKGAIGYGGLDVMTFGQGNKLTAGLNAIQGKGDYDREVLIENEVDRQEREAHPYYYAGGQVAGAFGLPNFGARSIPQFAKLGAAYGGAYGAGSSDTLAEVPGNVVLGAATGAAIPYGLQLTGRLARGAGAAAGRKIFGEATPEQQAILAAGEAEQVPINMGDVFPRARNSLATLETIPGSSGPVRGGIQAGRDALESRVASLRQGGNALEPETGGQIVQQTAEKFIKTSGARFDRQYGALEKATAGIKVPPAKSLSVADDIIARLSETPELNRAEIGFLNGLRKDLQSDLSIGALRRMRTKLRKSIAKGELTFGEDEAAVLSIMDAASKDIAVGLAAQGKGNVATRFVKLDKGYRDRMQFIGGTIQKLVGKRGQNFPPGQVFSNLKAMASNRGDARNFGRLLDEMDPAERSDIVATFVDAAATNNKGIFSPAHFVTSMEKLPRAFRIQMFGSDGEKSIQNLIRIMNAKDASIASLNNSRSGQVTNYRTVMFSVLAGLPGGGAAVGLAQAAPGAGALTGAAVGATGLALSRAWAKALMNEKFTRLVANTPATSNPKVMDAHFGRLRQLATKDPAIREVVEQLERKLIEAANDNLGGASRAAAEPESEQ